MLPDARFSGNALPVNRGRWQSCDKADSERAQDTLIILPLKPQEVKAQWRAQ
jgi:hypothetical protein